MTLGCYSPEVWNVRLCTYGQWRLELQYFRTPEGDVVSDNDPCRVVIADDVADFRELLRLCLTPDFCVVGEAAYGQEAIDKVRAEQPDAIILDISMPIKDGLAAIPEIRAGSPNTRILVLSGFTEASIGVQAIDLGAHAYLEKGSKIHHIEEKLTELCADPG